MVSKTTVWSNLQTFVGVKCFWGLAKHNISVILATCFKGKTDAAQWFPVAGTIPCVLFYFFKAVL